MNGSMSDSDFWQVIDAASGAETMDSKCSLLRDALADLSDEDLGGFVEQFDRVDGSLYAWPLWGAAYVINGGCGDDGFADFRACLISRGRHVVEAAVADPESLAELEVSPDDLFFEGFQYVALDVADQRGLELSQKRVSLPSEPSGDEWDEDSVVELFPRLAARFDPPAESTTGSEGSEKPAAKKPWWRFW